MLKVLLIDDEPLVIEGLISMIDWQSCGFKISGIANDGESGLSLITETEPDLVITDIRMPIMDGLQLIKASKAMIKKDIKFLVLSGYSDFEYIKAAINLDSFSYILKPIDADDIHQQLLDIKKHIIKEQVFSERLQENIDIVTRMTLNRIVREPVKATLIERAHFLMNHQNSSSYRYGALKCSKGSLSVLNVDEGILGHILGNRWNRLILEHRKEEIRWFIWSHKVEEFPSIEDIKSRIDDLCDIRCQLITSQVFRSISELRDHKKKVDQLLKYAFYYNHESLLSSGNDAQRASEDLRLFDIQKIITLLEKATEQEMVYELNILIRKIRREMLDPELLMICFYGFVEQMNEKYRNKFDPFEYPQSNPSDFCTFKTLFFEVTDYYRGQLMKMISTSNQDEIIPKIMAFVDQSYDQDIRLKTIAEKFGYNAVYLGQLFLKEAKVKYNEYVLLTRMKKAKVLLRYTNKKVYEIAAEVGFNNPDYFVQKFKELEGANPSLYRL